MLAFHRFYMEKVLTGLELRSLLREIETKVMNSYLNKIYQPNSRTLLLGLRTSEHGKMMMKIDSGTGLFLSQHDYKTSNIPPSFCMFLRKHLLNASLFAMKQQGLERVVEFKFNSKDGTKTLICELFGNGNFILCDSNNIILNLAANKTFKDRVLKRGETYEYPPEKFNVLELTQIAFLNALKKWESKKRVSLA